MPDDQTTMRKSTEMPTRATAAPKETKIWFDAVVPGMRIWAQSSAPLLAHVGELHEAMHLFSQSRLQANIDACNALSSCRNLAELAGHQRAYMENATGQYSRHAQNMVERTIAMMAAATKHEATES